MIPSFDRFLARFSVVCILLLAFFAVGCGGGGISETVRTPGSTGGGTVEKGGGTGGVLLPPPVTGPPFSLSVSSLDFGKVKVGATSPSQSVVVTNLSTTTALQVLTAVTSPAEFALTSAAPPLKIDPGKTATLSVAFTPTSAQSFTGALTITTDASVGKAVVTLTGVGDIAAPQFTVTPQSLDFGGQKVNTTSTVKQFQVTNLATSPADLVIQTMVVSDSHFTVTSPTLPATLKPGDIANFSVQFRPDATRTFSGTVTLTTNSPGGSSVVVLSGSGLTAQAAVTPSSLNFGTVAVGSSSTPQAIQVMNSATNGISLIVSAVTSSAAQFVVAGPALPVTLAPGQSASFPVTFQPDKGQAFSGSISITTDASAGTSNVAVQGTGSAPSLGVAPSSLTFGNQAVGVASAPQTITLTNTGALAAVTVSSVTSTASQFAVSGPAQPFTLNPGQSATFNVVFTPSAATAFSGAVSVASNAAPATVALNGTGIIPTPTATLLPATLTFGNQNVNTTSAPQTVQISNTSSNGASLSVSNFSVSPGAYSVTGPALPLTLTPGQNATYTVTFRPTSAGAANGSLSFGTNAGTLTTTLTGSGVLPTPDAQPTISPSSIAFGSQTVNTTSAPQTVQVTNASTNGATLIISGASASVSQFGVSGPALPVSLGPGQSASFAVSFTPDSAATFNGNLVLTTNAPVTTSNVPLSGTGTAANPNVQPGISPSSLTFGNQNVNTTSAPQTIQVTNTSTNGATLTISGVSSSAPQFAVSGPPMPVNLTPGQSANFSVTFTPTAGQAYSGSILFTMNTPSGSATVATNGTGVVPVPTATLTPGALTFGNQNVNTTSAAQTLQISNTSGNGASLQVNSLSVSAVEYTVTGPALPLTLTPGQNASYSVTFHPATTGAVNGTASFSTNAGTLTSTMSGTGVIPTPNAQPTISPASLAFGNQNVGTTSAPQTIQVSNASTNGATLTISGASSSSALYTISGPTLPVSLAPGASATFSATFAPTAAGAANATLTFTTNAPTPTSTASLSGTGVVPVPSATVAPTSLDFGSLRVSTTSAAQTIQVSNSSTNGATLTITSASSTASQFAVTGPALPVSLAPGQTATFSSTFAPSAAQRFSGSIVFQTNSGSGSLSVAATGVGVAPTVSVAPASLAFGIQALNTTSASKTITLTNTSAGALSVQLSSFSATPSQFVVSGPATPLTLAAGQSTTFSVTFTPTAIQAYSGSLTLNTDAGTQTVLLSGSGDVAQITASPSSLTFSTTAIGLSSAAQTFAITNSGTNGLSLTVQSVASNVPAFAVSGPATPFTLAPGASATYSVTFSPDSDQQFNGSINIASNATAGFTTVALTGNGSTPQITFSPSTIAFGDVSVSGTSAPQTITVTNASTNGLSLQITAASVSPNFTITSAPALPMTLNVGQSASFAVAFTPSALGPVNGFFTVTSNPTTGAPAVALSGNGVGLRSIAAATTISSPPFLDFSIQSINTTSSGQTFKITNSSTDGSVAHVTGISFSDPAFTLAAGPALPVTLAQGATATWTVKFTPSAARVYAATVTVTDDSTVGNHIVNLLGTGSLIAGLRAETPYTAVTDRVIRPEGTLPALGPAGFQFNDPDYGSRMVRVTDANTRPDRLNREYATPASAETSSWNTNSTMFYVEGGGGEVIPYRFDPTTMTPSRIGDVNNGSGGLIAPLKASPTFSFTDPDILYGNSTSSPAVIQQYKISTDTLITLNNPASCVTVGPYGRDMSVSGDDGRLGTWTGGINQDTDMIVYVYDKKLGCRWWNTQTGEIGGQWGPAGTAVPNISFLIHNARITKDGRFMRVSYSTAGVNNIFFWDIATLNVNPCSTNASFVSCQGHLVTGPNALINQRIIGDSLDFALRPITNLLDLNSLRVLVNPLLSPAEYVQDSHPSWNSARFDILVPMCSTIFRDDGTPIKRPWDNELVCMRTDAGSTVWRFAHTHSTNIGFLLQPRGNVSPDGRFFMFHSDWMGTVGAGRYDVFIVELK